MAKVSHRLFCALLLALPTVAVIALPLRARADSYGLEECDRALPGSAVLADLTVPLVCEQRPPGAPTWATGMWDGATIHLWVAGLSDAQTRHILGHEEGHAVSDQRPDLFQRWQQASGSTSREGFAECWALANYHEDGVGYQCPGGTEVLTWHETPAPPPTTVAPPSQPDDAPTPPEPAVVPLVQGRTPVELPAVTPLVEGSAAVTTLANERVVTMLGLIRSLSG